MTLAAQMLMGFWGMVAGAMGDASGVPAPAPAEPLLVIVERSDGATASPGQVRRAIAEELGRPVVGPGDAAGKAASQMLVVSLSPGSVAMQVRAAGDPAPRRRIGPVASSDADLRVVAWLAGNLARDQASELTDARPAAAAVRSAPTRTSQPSRLTAPPQHESEAAAVAAAPAAPSPQPDGEAPWRLELSVGRALSTEPYNWYEDPRTVGCERIEVLAPARPRQWSWAAGLDVINAGNDVHAYIVSAGLARRFELVPGWLAADAVVGGGLTNGKFSTLDPTGSPFPIGYLSAGLAIVRLPFGEIVTAARVVDLSEVWRYPYFTASAGLRVALR